ncbi:GAF domain-containing protein [Actinopolyspora lacussalsi]|nr:GAF domain-containing protein [Actinopolyspora lacussalsi]
MSASNMRLVGTPPDPNAQHRMERLRELGIREEPDPQFDALARRLADAAGAPYAMVNIISGQRQYFTGLYTRAESQTSAAMEAAQTAVSPGREMPKDHGFCPHVVSRGLPLVLGDVCSYPRFTSNPVVDQIGIRSYMGAPLIDHTGLTLGTVCTVAPETHSWGRRELETIKDFAAEVMELVHGRERP